MRIKALSAIFIVLLCTHSVAEEMPTLVWSYTMEEIYQMAMFFKNARTGKDLDDLSQYIKAAEFKGYVSAIIDNSINQDKQLTDCARKYPVNDIAMRTALVITSSPLDRSQMSPIAVHVGVRFACDEAMWKKQ